MTNLVDETNPLAALDVAFSRYVAPLTTTRSTGVIGRVAQP